MKILEKAEINTDEGIVFLEKNDNVEIIKLKESDTNDKYKFSAENYFNLELFYS